MSAELRSQHLDARVDDLVDLHRGHFGFARLPGEHAHVLDDVGHAISLGDDAPQPVFDPLLVQVPVAFVGDVQVLCQPPHAHQWLVQLVGDAGGHFSQ